MPEPQGDLHERLQSRDGWPRYFAVRQPQLFAQAIFDRQTRAIRSRMPRWPHTAKLRVLFNGLCDDRPPALRLKKNRLGPKMRLSSRQKFSIVHGTKPFMWERCLLGILVLIVADGAF